MAPFIDWLARLGAPGSTARWAAKGYRFFRQRHPDPEEFPDSAVFHLLIVHRYERLKDDAKQEALLRRADALDGLMGLVVEILRVEASLAANSPEGMAAILGAVGRELEKSGLHRSVLFGTKAGFPDFVRQAYAPAADP